ncbi:hypothetical protein FOZ62_017278 [Perkinsus olseni]|uniref:Uncharacterized protein n=1 Tax=Perkinsus olseni TaxID=32597 RepID=A0A7J6SCD7_PEROL|nr:hypothetical protein FOZ62_017278 [Perkinsus olseni]
MSSSSSSSSTPTSSPPPTTSSDVPMEGSSEDETDTTPIGTSAFYVSTLQPSTAVVSARSIAQGRYLVVARVANRVQIFGPFENDETMGADGSDLEEAAASVMENGPLLEVPVMGRIMVMEVVRDEYIFFTTAKRQFGLWRFRGDSTTALEAVCSGMLANLYPYPATDNCLRPSHTVCYDNKSGAIAIHLFRGQLFVIDIDSILRSKQGGDGSAVTGQAYRMDSVPDAIDMCMLPPREGKEKGVTLAVLFNEEPISSELKIIFYQLDTEEKTLELASQDTYPKIDVTERQVKRILPSSWQELIAVGPRTISKYHINQGEYLDDFITTKLTTEVAIDSGAGKWFLVDDEGWLHTLNKSESLEGGEDLSRYYVGDTRKGKAGKRRRAGSTRQRGKSSVAGKGPSGSTGKSSLVLETLGPVSKGASSAVAVLLDGKLIFVASDVGDAHRLCRIYSCRAVTVAHLGRTIGW